MLRACIDIGSNTTRLLVAECGAGGLESLHQERAFTHLGRGRLDDGTITRHKLEEVTSVVAAQLARARELGATDIRGIATAAIRQAPNGAELAEAIRQSCGLAIEVLTGEREARLAFLGASRTLGHAPEGALGVVDVGGGSSEIVVGTLPEGVSWSASFGLGSGNLTETRLHSDPPSERERFDDARSAIEETLAGLDVPHPAEAVAVGGSAASLRRVAGSMLDADAFSRALSLLGAEPARAIARRFELDVERVRLLPAALLILQAAAEAFASPLRVGLGGIREGLLLERRVADEDDHIDELREAPPARHDPPLDPREALAEMRIRAPTRGNRRLEALIDAVNADPQVKAWWHVSAVNATRRLGMSDHSWVHIQIVLNVGLRLGRLLFRRGVVPSVVADYGFSERDAEVVIAAGCLLHCVGMAIDRKDHEHFSLFLTADKLPELLAGSYEEPARTIIVSEALHAINGHRRKGRPRTVEAGIVRVADALDMARGRSRVPFESGRQNIHSLSAYAIEEVKISPGEDRAVRVEISMSNSAGIYQVDELLATKLRGSGLEEHIEVIARIDAEHEQRLLPVFPNLKAPVRDAGRTGGQT